MYGLLSGEERPRYSDRAARTAIDRSGIRALYEWPTNLELAEGGCPILESRSLQFRIVASCD